MKDPPIGRTSMVERLVTHTAAAVSSDPDGEWLRFILKRGFIGYEHMSETQLRNELERCGLIEMAFDDGEDDLEVPGEGELIDELAGCAGDDGARRSER
jgi:hypothetical protein